ncbi:MAG: hypothetical protein FIB04_14520 [Gammaproteobacteria bacterium]|nr:hypothetical protein [Gammaproteobacteria bacterium]
MSGTRLSSYKLSHDTGFAPNPFFGTLTLATGVPDIRQAASMDDWIAGFTSTQLCGDAVGTERLVFLMRVEEVLSIAEYFGDRRFARKIPSLAGGPEVHRHGDNIYQPICDRAAVPEHFEQLRNLHHWDHAHDCEDARSKRHDVGGRRVLVATEFVYFGREALQVPDFARPVVPRGSSRIGVLTRDSELARAFIDFALARASRPVTAAPHEWPANDASWRH